MMAGIKPEKLELAQKFTVNMSKIISRTEEDGVGYAAITSDGKLYGEKWVNKADAFKIHEQPVLDNKGKTMEDFFQKAAKFKKEIPGSKIYQDYGSVTAKNVKNTVAIMLHARKKTQGEKSVANTHPFFELGVKDQPDTALIHNGSITNHEKLTKKHSTCDSETLLHEYIDNTMWYNPEGVKDLAKTVTGMYTVGVLTSIHLTDAEILEREAQGLSPRKVIPILDIFKFRKDLHAAYIPELETMVFATTDSIIEECARDLNMTVQHLMEVNDGFLIRVNAITGERMIDVVPFDGTAWHSYSGYQGPSTKPYGESCNLPKPNETAKADDSDDETVEDVKVNFEMNHKEIFNKTYYDISHSELTDAEKSLFSELEKNDKTDHKALHLVKLALNF